ncbi:MAG: hypothetical protein K8T26_16785 [Lentisphaerae bacterium]|nr:hypothetical protein [Lentisphaerota bacterium]
MTASDGLQIGWASRDITPDQPVSLAGQFHVRLSQGVRDPITVTALCLASGADVCIWVSCDLVGVTVALLAECRECLRQRLPQFPVEKLVMNVTHTHTAPDAKGGWYPPLPEGVMQPAAYASFVAGRVAEAAAESWGTRQPGSVSWGFGYAVVGHNRRAVYFDDLSQRADFERLVGTKTEKHARMYGNVNDCAFSGLEGGAEHAVNLLFTFDAASRLTGAVYNLPCPSQETEQLTVISADFWHEVRVELRRRHGEHLFLLPQCAPAGDLSPHVMVNQKAERRMLELRKRTTRQEIAARLAAAFDDVYAAAGGDRHAAPVFKHEVREISLPRRRITDEEYRAAEEGVRELEALRARQAAATVPPGYWEQPDVCFSRGYRCRRIVERHAEQQAQPELPMEMHVMRVGDVVFATNAFELFMDYGHRIVARSPAVQTFLVQLAAGGRASYLPTARAEAGESYSACLYCNEVGSAGGQKLVEETVHAIQALWPS